MRPTHMRVHVFSFGPLRAHLPEGGRWIDLVENSTVGELLAELEQERVFEAPTLKAVAVAINEEYVRHDQRLTDNDEVAILPPVSGGSGPMVALVQDAIDSARIVEGLKAGEDGAVVVFDGVVRNNTRGRSTLHLDYEAYEAMALKQMFELRDTAIERFGVRDVAIVHRLGRLVVGETSVLIAVASAHRGAAFEANRWVIDTLKKTVPIWKKEQFVDGAVWADGEPFPETIVAVPE